jgi:hypothetical protein
MFLFLFHTHPDSEPFVTRRIVTMFTRVRPGPLLSQMNPVHRFTVAGSPDLHLRLLCTLLRRQDIDYIRIDSNGTIIGE